MRIASAKGTLVGFLVVLATVSLAAMLIPSPAYGSESVTRSLEPLSWEFEGNGSDPSDSMFLDLTNLSFWRDDATRELYFELEFNYPFGGQDLWPNGESALYILMDTDGRVSTGEEINDGFGSDFALSISREDGYYSAHLIRTPSRDTDTWEDRGRFGVYVDTSNGSLPSTFLGVGFPASAVGEPASIRTLAFSEWVSPIGEEFVDWLPDSGSLEFAAGNASSSPSPNTGFTDVGGGHPYRDAIVDLADREVIEGYNDNTFRPGEPVWRQHFAKMIVLSLQLPVSEADVSPFGDVSTGGSTTLYPDNYIAVAAEQGITKGTGEGRFGPYNNITRAQVVTMSVRAALNLNPGALADPPGSFEASIGNFSSVHYPNLRIAEYNGLLDGIVNYGPGWDPWEPATRGEVAEMLWSMMKGME